MSPRSATRFSALALSAAAFAGAAFAFTACSSSEDPATPTAEAGVEAGGDAKPAPDANTGTDSATKPTFEQCVDQCFKDHPSSKAKYDAVDTCWAASCKGPCVDENGMFDAGAEAGTPDAGGNDGGNGLCGTEIASGIDKACDDCTEANCCTAWEGCYKDKDCLELNDCIGTCAEQ